MIRASVSLAALAMLAVVGAPAFVAAQPTLQVAIDQTDVAAGAQVAVTMTGFVSRVVTLSTCGNLAKRGSGDCALVASRAVRLDPSGTTTAAFTVAMPPAPCPCVVRAASRDHDEVAMVPIRVAGAPVAPVVDPSAAPLLDVTMRARPAPKGIVSRARAALGGPTTYAVTVSVTNRSRSPIDGVVLAGSAGRGRAGDAVDFRLPTPGAIGPGATWRHMASVTLPAPALGRWVWEVTATGAGPTVRVERATRRVPFAFVVAMAVVIVDLLTIARRRSRRHRDRVSTGRTLRRAPAPA